MGHARTYVSFDIIRRIMTDYFGYNVKLVMNITDIDDKIIRKAIEAKVDFTEISRRYEAEFLDDMKRLNVSLPDCVTRVSEYVPEIVAFIETIIANGFAYESNGSVYFDVKKYSDSPDHTYAKLEPTSVNNKEKLAEGEGVLTNAEAPEKRNEADFALWKKSKPEEPKWQSPWGEGRPGWHIECSAMAASIFKTYPIDIHTGGVDLRFPHHDNEIAQSEAFYKCDNWINNFWHTGHLHIAGKKMSKSLKNFITINNILETYNPRQVRFLFLIHTWSTLMNYTTEKSLPEAVNKERKFTEFFRQVKAATRQTTLQAQSQKWTPVDEQLSQALSKTQRDVREALCDSFDTPRAVNELSNLVSLANTYLQLPQPEIKEPLVRQVSKYVFFILKCFGVYTDDDTPSQAAEATGDYEQIITPLMNALSQYRDKVKAGANEGPKTMFQLSD
jgi:cysteinyl-tRNA synthetase